MADLRTRLRNLERRRRAAPAALPGGGVALTGEELAGRLGVTGETVRRWAGLGMPSCGTHPTRPAWPVYDEGACRAWAAEHQPQTELRAATGDAVIAGGSGGVTGLAAERVQALRLRCQQLKMDLMERRSRLISAAGLREVGARHAAVVRARVGEVPARAAARLAEAANLGDEARGTMEAILAAEVRLVLAELRDDPLAAVGAGSYGFGAERSSGAPDARRGVADGGSSGGFSDASEGDAVHPYAAPCGSVRRSAPRVRKGGTATGASGSGEGEG